MFSRICKRFTYTNIAMTLALVFAMTGGAYAASKYVITSTKQISPKVVKSLRGKTGSAGVAGAKGANGTNGSPGPAGEKGATGANGANGTNGAPGTNGTSVTSKALAKEDANCKEGGSEFVAAESKKTYACNGSPWTVNGALPTGKTETGTWTYTAGAAGAVFAGISFPIPLAHPLDATHVHYLYSVQGSTAECPGTNEKPEAEPGDLCIYQTIAHGVEEESSVAKTEILSAGEAMPGAGVSGAAVLFVATEPASGFGTWAVTEK